MRLLGNVFVSGSEIDALLICQAGIVVIEFKAMGGEIEFSENGPWTADGYEIRGGNQINPFAQVRSNRFSVIGWLKQNQRALAASQEAKNILVRAAVCFGKSITPPTNVPPKVQKWLTICRDNDVRSIVPGASKRYRLTGQSVNSIANALEGKVAKAKVRKRRFLYLKVLGFTASIQDLVMAGGQAQQGAQAIKEKLSKWQKHPDSFENEPYREHSKIEESRLYTFGNTTLITVFGGKDVYVCHACLEANEEGWMDSHEGLRVTMDERGHLHTTREGVEEVEPQDPYAESTSSHLSDFLVPDLETLVPIPLVRKALLGLDTNSSETEIEEVLESIQDQSVQAFLRDLLSHLRAGDREQAEARLGLFQGDATPLNQEGAVETFPEENSANADTVTQIPDHLLKTLLKPGALQDWMLYLHPDQQKIVDSHEDRIVVLQGVSGSGKTCILIHRAQALAKRYPSERIGILTLNENLAVLIREMVEQLVDPQLLSQINVFAFYEYFQLVLKEVGATKYFEQIKKAFGSDHPFARHILSEAADPHRFANQFDPNSKETLSDCLAEAVNRWGSAKTRLTKYLQWEGVKDAAGYIEDELMLIRSEFVVTTRDKEYPKMKRKGRGVPFRRDHRRDLLSLLRIYEEYMIFGDMCDQMGLTQALVTATIPERLRFRSLLIDEFQDFCSLDIILIRNMVYLNKPDNLFLAGDLSQKVTPKLLTLRKAGLDKGTARYISILKNYRNSRQILEAAFALLEPYRKDANALGVEVEELKPEYAVRQTAKPLIKRAQNVIATAWSEVQAWLAGGHSPYSTCIATTAGYADHPLAVERIVFEKPNGINAAMINGRYLESPDRVVVAPIEEVKGFEFSLIVIIGLDANQFPVPKHPESEHWRDAFKLYVAMTRGRDQVSLIYSQQPSEFLTRMASHCHWPEMEIWKTLESADDAKFSATLKKVPEEDLEYILTSYLSAGGKIPGPSILPLLYEIWPSEKPLPRAWTKKLRPHVQQTDAGNQRIALELVGIEIAVRWLENGVVDISIFHKKAYLRLFRHLMKSEIKDKPAFQKDMLSRYQEMATSEQEKVIGLAGMEFFVNLIRDHSALQFENIPDGLSSDLFREVFSERHLMLQSRKDFRREFVTRFIRADQSLRKVYFTLTSPRVFVEILEEFENLKIEFVGKFIYPEVLQELLSIHGAALTPVFHNDLLRRVQECSESDHSSLWRFVPKLAELLIYRGPLWPAAPNDVKREAILKHFDRFFNITAKIAEIYLPYENSVFANPENIALTDKDRELALRWCANPSQETEVRKMESARRAEVFVAKYCEGLGLSVEDVAILQLQPESMDWKKGDLRIMKEPVSRLIDVKNARRTSEQSAFGEHCVPKFKKTRSEDVLIAAVLSPFVETSGDPLIFLGFVHPKHVSGMGRHFAAKSNIMLTLPRQGRSEKFLPPWLFDYSNTFYKIRNELLTQLSELPDEKFPIWEDMELVLEEPSEIDRFLSAIIASFRHLPNDWLESLPPWKASFINHFSAPESYRRIALPLIFLNILTHFISSISTPISGFSPANYKDFFLADRFPFATLDPLDIIEKFCDTLETLWKYREVLADENFKGYRFNAAGVLQGRKENSTLTILAYCGGRDEEGPCGFRPLVYGVHKTCICGKLKCPDCFYCTEACKHAYQDIGEVTET